MTARPAPPASPVQRAVLGLGLLCGFAALGQGAATVLHLPLPGSVLGLILLLLALSLRWVRLEWVELAADGLLGLLSLLFVPAAVGVVEYLGAWRAWPGWLLVMAAGVLIGGAVAGLLASRLGGDELHALEAEHLNAGQPDVQIGRSVP
ncbi:CidA/LrgA family protein [Deinococcus aquiradiocola]|uniref:CidA/LrgA family protein n=1 Tax=Deinococcus aquiradiocola TaxID=393059 RepID=A0A917P6K6_9DEIO|nr:CidA/LrgA family protein [Deinococcus aquiradiocola]GGJ64219.1 CidA/LrgA family protein [Deinococcus aquiradiocola]